MLISEINRFYYTKVSKDYFNKSLDVLTDMICNPLFNDEEIEREFVYEMPDELRAKFSKSDNITFDVKTSPRYDDYATVTSFLYGDPVTAGFSGMKLGDTTNKIRFIKTRWVS